MTAHTRQPPSDRNPVSWKKAVRALKWTNGTCTDVTETEIADAKAMIGRDGIGCEPASATTLAGIRKLVSAGDIDKDENVVGILTEYDERPRYAIIIIETNCSRKISKTATTQASGKISAGFANPPQQVSVNKEAIKRLLGL